MLRRLVNWLANRPVLDRCDSVAHDELSTVQPLSSFLTDLVSHTIGIYDLAREQRITMTTMVCNKLASTMSAKSGQ